jgi:Short C-terminal domain
MPGLLRGVARTAVVAGTASAVGGRVRHRQDQRWAAEEAQQQPEPQYYAPPPAAAPVYAPPAAAPAAPVGDPVEQLTQLAKLKEQGILTDAEFSAQKARILAG